MKRREFIKAGLAGAGFAMLPASGAAAKGKGKRRRKRTRGGGSGGGGGGGGGGGSRPNTDGGVLGRKLGRRTFSPKTEPWQMELPIMPELPELSSFSNFGSAYFRNPKQGPGTRIANQHSMLEGLGYEFSAPPKKMEIRVKKVMAEFHPRLRGWAFGYNGIVPGPTIVGHIGRPNICRIFNDLPANHQGPGVPTISTHHHNVHGPFEDDGNPLNFFGPGEYWDYSWPNLNPCTANLAAGETMPPSNYPYGDPCERGSTNWYHDHMVDHTAENVYMGLAGQYRFYDEVDSGDETDSNPKALRLPSGKYDIGLIITDALFNGDGDRIYDRFEHNGFLGDKQLVNGASQPVLKVERRKYRFRILTAANARWFQLFLSSGQKFVHIATDGGLLPSPLKRRSIRSATAERNEVIIDFSRYRDGDQVFLENRMDQTDGRGPIRVDRKATYQLLRFDVGGPRVADPSRCPRFLRALPVIDLSKVTRRRTFEFERKHGGWVINGRFFDDNFMAADIPVGEAEIWTLRNKGGGWWHPIHIHLEYFRVLTRNGRRPPKWEVAKKDVFELPPKNEVEIYLRARTFRSRWVMHCHNLEHEDMAMMTNFRTV